MQQGCSVTFAKSNEPAPAIPHEENVHEHHHNSSAVRAASLIYRARRFTVPFPVTQMQRRGGACLEVAAFFRVVCMPS